MEGKFSRTSNKDTMNVAVNNGAVLYTTGSPSLARSTPGGDSILIVELSRVWEFLAPTLFNSRKA